MTPTSGESPKPLVARELDHENGGMAPWVRKALSVLFYIVVGIVLTWGFWLRPGGHEGPKRLSPPSTCPSFR